MIPLYILGMLLRYGPQHGYQIKKMLMEQLADFTDIKLPTIYYHLEKMETAGFITAQNIKEGLRPEKRVYVVTEAGQDQFRWLLRETLEIEYRPTFSVDSALFFSDSLEPGELARALRCHIANMEEALERIEAHRAETLAHLPQEMQVWADLIFEHHARHYQAELAWASSAAERLNGEGIK